MIDRYTKIVLTVIAAALIALVVRPLFEARITRAGDTVDVNIVGIAGIFPSRGIVPVRCVDGCRQ